MNVNSKMLVAAIVFLFASGCSLVRADSLSLSYAVTGHGGFSQPIAGVSDTLFVWLDSTGGVSTSVPSGYGITIPNFNPTTGSVILSSPFDLGANESISVTTEVISNEVPYFDWVGVYLLSGAQVVDTLYGQIPGALTDFEGNQITLGGITYGPGRLLGAWGACSPVGVPAICAPGGSTPSVTSSDTPGAGEYQLLFISYNTIDQNIASALAVESVTTPEPSSLLLLLGGIISLAGISALRTRLAIRTAS